MASYQYCIACATTSDDTHGQRFDATRRQFQPLTSIDRATRYGAEDKCYGKDYPSPLLSVGAPMVTTWAASHACTTKRNLRNCWKCTTLTEKWLSSVAPGHSNEWLPVWAMQYQAESAGIHSAIFICCLDYQAAKSLGRSSTKCHSTYLRAAA